MEPIRLLTRRILFSPALRCLTCKRFFRAFSGLAGIYNLLALFIQTITNPAAIENRASPSVRGVCNAA
jgi:hypothetical protein